MPNCDWNSPCNCRDCSEIIETHVCLSCQFPNKVSIDGIARWVDDRKHGGGDYVFDAPTSPIKDLYCYDCGHHMSAVGYYTSVAETLNQHQKERANLILAGKFCASCSKIEGIDFDRGIFGKVVLNNYNGRLLCKSCFVETVKQEQPDPSDNANKYVFSQEKLIWVLERVKIPCRTCGKSYLVSVSEQSWRKQCKTCYKRR